MARKQKKTKKFNVRAIAISFFGAFALWLVICSIGFADFPLNLWLGIGRPIDLIVNAVVPILTFVGAIGGFFTGNADGGSHFYVSLLILFIVLWAVAFAILKAASRISRFQSRDL